MNIQSAVIVITGGASGMGAATAKRLSQAGAKVITLDLHSSADFVCDVTEDSAVKAVFEKIQEPIHACINCAGIVSSKRMVGKEGPLPLEEFYKVININLIGTFNVMRFAAAKMIPQAPLPTGERGVIINTASVAAYEGQIGQVAYSASKGGIVGMTLPAARELAQFGIRVMTIAPGLVDTPMFSKIPDEARQALAASVPFPKRLADPDEYAQLAQQIIENPMLNGSVIRLDGALRMAPK